MNNGNKTENNNGNLYILHIDSFNLAIGEDVRQTEIFDDIDAAFMFLEDFKTTCETDSNMEYDMTEMYSATWNNGRLVEDELIWTDWEE